MKTVIIQSPAICQAVEIQKTTCYKTVEIQIPGIQGPVPDIEVAAKTLPAGSSASVEKTGSDEKPLLTFGIPQGEKGEPGSGSASINPIDDSFINNLFGRQ